MKTYPHLFNKLFCQPVMVLESVFLALENDLLSRMGLAEANPSLVRSASIETSSPAPAMVAAAASGNGWRVDRIYQDFGSVAVLSIDGVIDKHLSGAELDCYGGVDLDDVNQALSIAENDDELETLVIYPTSPGGSVIGVPETAARVRALAQTKQVLAYVDVMACSAAYYIASQADQIVTTPSAILGSIGVYCAVLDQTKALEMKGLKVELIRAGKYKAMGSSLKPLEDDERDMLQADVNSLRDDFRGAVSGARPQVSNDTMEGQTFTGKQSLAVGLADATTNASLDEYVAALL